MLRKILVLAAATAVIGGAGFAFAAGSETHMENVAFSFEGPFGTFDQAQLQRGYKVYQEVCENCHSASLLSFRNLGEKYGPFYEEGVSPTENGYVKAIAAMHMVADIDSETGDAIERPATPADRFPWNFPNEAAARAANNNALPPDLSVIAKARHGGADYLYTLLVSYHAPPAGAKMLPGTHYNTAFPGDMSSLMPEGTEHMPAGGVLSMPPPLKDGAVTFDDGKPSTVKQQARDVAAFLAWASDPRATERKRAGLMVMTYLIILSGLLYVSYRRVWRNESH